MADSAEHLLPASGNYISAEVYHEEFVVCLLLHVAVGIESIFQRSDVINKWVVLPAFK